MIESIVLSGEGGWGGGPYLARRLSLYRHNENIVSVVKKKSVADTIDNIVFNVKKSVVDIFQKLENGYTCLHWKYD